MVKHNCSVNILVIVFSFLLFSLGNIYSQDTLKPNIKKDSTRLSQKFLLSNTNFQYLKTDNPDTVTRNRILWYPLKLFEDVFTFIPGYFLRYMDVGQINQLNYNQLEHNYTVLMRHGRPINDLLDGSLDFNLISRNEVAELELTNGFGNFLYNYSNGINLMQRQLFPNRPYSEISYWQDRFENLYFDGNYHQNIFKKLNFNFGITKHSYTGKYTNSDFDKWQGRFNFNFNASKNINLFLYSHYSKIQRGLNEGIDPEKVLSFDRETLFNASTAIVENSDAYEIRERFDIDFGLLWLQGKNKNSFTKLQFFTSNSFRKYRDEENRPNPNKIYIIDNSHWIDYGFKFQQYLRINVGREFHITSRSEGEFNYDILLTNLNSLRESNRIYLLQDFVFNLGNFSLNTYVKAFKFKYYENKFYTDFGIKGGIKHGFDSLTFLDLSLGYSRWYKLPSYQQYFLNNSDSTTALNHISMRGLFGFKFGSLLAEYYVYKNHFYKIAGVYSDDEKKGMNIKLNLKFFIIELEANYSKIFPFVSTYGTQYPQRIYTFPKNSGIVSLSYHDIHFKNKFEVKVGILSRFWTEYYLTFYNGFYNTFSSCYSSDNRALKVGPNSTLDFFIIGKINKAVFGLTLENILNRLIVTSGLYPYQNRGGLANVVSRFNVTWYFLN